MKNFLLLILISFSLTIFPQEIYHPDGNYALIIHDRRDLRVALRMLLGQLVGLEIALAVLDIENRLGVPRVAEHAHDASENRDQVQLVFVMLVVRRAHRFPLWS